MEERFYDFLNESTQETKSGDEIAQEVIERAGLRLIEDECV